MDRSQSKTWEEQDLLRLIEYEVQEDGQLDYKGCGSLQKTDAKRKEISKDVSSFANAGGGIIIYGICEDENNHFPEKLDEGLDPNEFPKEWLEQVIQGNVRPRVEGIHINQVALESSYPGKVAYVVTIPQSVTAHQAADNRYYKRFNFMAVPMAHHEILDVLNRQKTPLIRPSFSFSPSGNACIDNLQISIINKGAVLAQQLKLVFTWPKSVPIAGIEGITKKPKEDHNEFIFYSHIRPVYPEDEIPLRNWGHLDFAMIIVF